MYAPLVKRMALILGIVLLLVILFKAPLAKLTSPSGNYLYINNAVVARNEQRITIGPKTVAVGAPLRPKKTVKIFVLPFRSYNIQSSDSMLTIDDILRATNSSDSDYVVGASKFLLGNRWLVVTLGSPQPDGGAYSVILYWDSTSGEWRRGGTYDGGDSLSFNAPGAVRNYLGVSR